MSPLAWKILSIFLGRTADMQGDESWTDHSTSWTYITAWELGEILGGDANTINSIDVKIHPRNKQEAALKELLDLGLVEEMEDLHCRYKLIVKEPIQQELKPVEPTVAEYWKQPPSVQGKLREKVQPPVEPSRCIVKMESEGKK